MNTTDCFSFGIYCLSFQTFSYLSVLKRSQIIELLDLGPRQHLFKECLPYAAYTYSNGPFSNLWIRFGYDPSFHPSSRIYQLLNCRFPPQYLMTLSDRFVKILKMELGLTYPY